MRRLLESISGALQIAGHLLHCTRSSVTPLAGRIGTCFDSWMRWRWTGLIVLLVVVATIVGYVLGSSGGDSGTKNGASSSESGVAGESDGNTSKEERECAIAFNTSRDGPRLATAIAKAVGEEHPAWVGRTPDGLCAAVLEVSPGLFNVLQESPGESGESIFTPIPGYKGEEENPLYFPSVPEKDLPPWAYPFNATLHTGGIWLTSAEEEPEF